MLASRTCLILSLAVGLSACGVHSAQFSKDSVSIEQRDLDFADCQAQAGRVAGTVAVEADVPTDTVKSLQVDTVGDCMIGKGYTR